VKRWAIVANDVIALTPPLIPRVSAKYVKAHKAIKGGEIHTLSKDKDKT